MKHLLIIVAALFLTGTSKARILCAPSIEWLVDQSDSIGIYKVGTLTITDRPSGDPHPSFGRAALKGELIATEKGKPPFGCEATYMIVPIRSDTDIGKQIAQGDLLVCFFHKVDGLEKVLRTCNLTSPPLRGDNVLYSSTFTILKTEADIIKAIDSRLNCQVASYNPDSSYPTNWIEIPMDKEAYDSLHAMSGSYLIIPPDLQKPNAGVTNGTSH
jgi:hypothetical protein